MDPERWQTVQEILLQALELEAEERSAYLDEACSDTEIRREVESLLGAETAFVRGLDQPAVDLLASPAKEPGTFPESSPQKEPGTSSDRCSAQEPGSSGKEPGTFSGLEVGGRIGAYKLLREIGRGGMGTVWLAARDDQEFERLVAIKVIKRGHVSRAMLSRFEYERQAPALLSHESIARN